MKNVRKYLIKGIAGLLAMAVLIVSPASKYLDTQGIADTHASSVVTGVLTLGAAASLALLTYNVIVPEEHEMVVANEVFNWVEEHVESARESIAELRKGAVTWVIDKTVLEGVKHYLESKGVNPEEPHTVSMSVNLDKFTFDTLPGLSDVDRSNLRNLSISNVALINQYLSGFRGFYSRQVDDGKVISSFWEIDLSEYDGAFKNSFGGLSFYKLGDIDNAVELRNIAYRDDGANLLSNIFKFTYYPDVLTQGSFNVQTFSEFCDSRVDSASTIGALAQSFANVNHYGSKYYPFDYIPYYNGTPFLYSSSIENAVKGIYEPYPNTAEISGSATSYGGYALSNVEKLTGALITQQIARDILKSSGTEIKEKSDDETLAPKDLSNAINGIVAQSFYDKLFQHPEIVPPVDDTNVSVLDKYKEEIQYADGVTKGETTDLTIGEQALLDQSVTNTNGIVGALNKVIAGLTTIIASIVDLPARDASAFVSSLTSIYNAIISIPQKLTDLMEKVLTELFVPDTSVLQEKVGSLSPIMTLKNTLGRFIEPFKLINVSEPPHMYIHFENAEDERFQSIGTLKILDMSWYKPYKAYGDFIFSAVIWMFFVLRLRKSMPSILNGVSGGGEVLSEFKQ